MAKIHMDEHRKRGNKPATRDELMALGTKPYLHSGPNRRQRRFDAGISYHRGHNNRKPTTGREKQYVALERAIVDPTDKYKVVTVATGHTRSVKRNHNYLYGGNTTKPQR